MACKKLMISWYSYIPQAMPRKQDTTLRDWPKFATHLQAFVWTFWAYQRLATIFFDFEMNRILLLPCHLLLRMHLTHSWLNGLQKTYDLMVFLHTAGDAKKARHHLARMTKTCNQLVSSHMKYKSDLLLTGNIWPYDSSYKLAANPQHIWCLILTFKYSYCLTGLSTIYWCTSSTLAGGTWASLQPLLQPPRIS